MMTIRYSILTLAVAALLCGCEKLRPEGAFTVEEITLQGDPHRIAVGSGFTLTLSDDIPEGVIRIGAHENIHEYIVFDETGDQVSIYLETSRPYDRLQLEAWASPATFDALEASGGSRIEADDMPAAESLLLTLSGGSTMEGEVSCGTLTAYLSGGSRATLSGTANTFSLPDCSGGSRVNAFPLECRAFDGNLSGGSRVEISVSESLHAENSGGSALYYKGDPQQLVVNNSGGSTVTKQ